MTEGQHSDMTHKGDWIRREMGGNCLPDNVFSNEEQAGYRMSAMDDLEENWPGSGC
ncbi:hypothetical protein [Paenibacillus chungangensis]|uniref:Uncharacterized protein n=1 Tax=Paenibacillus chungangensis TaxID=696535 RepID=A0ABW3HLH5_9BACL